MTNLRLLPNIHLLLVHLSAALLFAGTVFLIAGRLFAARAAGDSLLHAGRWNVWSGALLSIATVATGAFVISQARLDPVAAATAALHLRTAIVASVLALGAAIAIRQAAARAPGWVAVAVLAVSCGAMGVSALAGAQLIHRHGLGIERPREEPRMPVAMVPVSRKG